MDSRKIRNSRDKNNRKSVWDFINCYRYENTNKLISTEYRFCQQGTNLMFSFLSKFIPLFKKKLALQCEAVVPSTQLFNVCVKNRDHDGPHRSADGNIW